MKPQVTDWQLLEALVHDEDFDISYLSIELPDGNSFIAER